MTSLAFNTAVNPFGTELQVMLGSDISHWDLPDVSEVLRGGPRDGRPRLDRRRGLPGLRVHQPGPLLHRHQSRPSSRGPSWSRPSPGCSEGRDVLDLVIRGGTVVDGTGAPGPTPPTWPSSDGRIVAVGHVADDGRPEHRRHGRWWCARGSSTSTRTTTPSCCGTRRRARRCCTGSPLSSAATAASPSPRSAPGDAEYVQAMMAVVEGMPRAALEGGGPWTWRRFAEYLDRVDGADWRSTPASWSATRPPPGGRWGTRPPGTVATDRTSWRPWSRLVAESLAGGAPRVLVVAGGGPPRRRPPPGAVELRRPSTSSSRSAGALRRPSGHDARVHPADRPDPRRAGAS